MYKLIMSFCNSYQPASLTIQRLLKGLYGTNGCSRLLCTQPQLPTLPNLKAKRLDTALCQHAVIWQNIKRNKVFFKIVIIIKKRNSLKAWGIAGKLFLCLIITEKRGLPSDRTSNVQTLSFTHVSEKTHLIHPSLTIT